MTVLRDPLLSCAKLVETGQDRSAFGVAAEAEEAGAFDRDRAELGALYASHGAAIHRFLCDLLGDRALAADATQETFVRAHRRLRAIEDRSRALPWLFGVARNVSLELRRARVRAGRVFAREGDAHVESAPSPAHGTPEATLIGREAARVVSRALDALSDDRRAVLLLRMDHGLAYDEIAETMGWTLAKVKVEIHRAREALRATLAAYQGGAR